MDKFKTNIPSYMAQADHAAKWLDETVQSLRDTGYQEIALGVWENAETDAIVEL